MSAFGTITEFNPKGDWSSYKERLEFYFEANNISEEEKKRAVFFRLWARKHELVRGLIAPRKPKELVYDNIVKELDTHFTPSVNVIVERFKFYDFENHQINQ